MVTRDQVLGLIRNYLETIRDIRKDSVTLETRLEDLNIDSLDKMELVFGLEHELNIKIVLGLQNVPPVTVGDVVGLVLRNAATSASIMG